MRALAAQAGSAAQLGGPVSDRARPAGLSRRRCCAPGSRLHEFVSPDDVRSLLDAFFAAPLEEGRGYTVSMLLTFSSWLEAHG